MGSPVAFVAAVALVVVWALSGPLFGFGTGWQLVINTGTTIITFLMIFLVQNTQNRDSLAIQLKLDELIRGTHGPRESLIDLENLDDEELRELQQEFERLAGHTADTLDEAADHAEDVKELADQVQDVAAKARTTPRASGRRAHQ